MQRTTMNFATMIGVVLVLFLSLALVFFAFGRRYAKPLLPENLGDLLFPPVATPIDRDYGPVFGVKELPETPSSIVHVAARWAAERGREFGSCERLTETQMIAALERRKSQAVATDQATGSPIRIDDDPDYAACLRYVRSRLIDRGTENAMPGRWLPGRESGDRARHDFESILERRPDFFYAAYLLGCWHRQNGDTETATRYFEQAYANAPVVLVMSFDLIELAESWEQDSPPQLTLINNRTFAHNVDLTYHYGVDDNAMVRYPMLRADQNGLVVIPAEREWLTWERTFYTGRRVPDEQNAAETAAFVVDELPADERVIRKTGRAWCFRGLANAVSLLQHEEIIVRPYDTNLMRTDPFFDPVWGVQPSLAPYEHVATYCENRNEPSFLFDRGTLTPASTGFATCWQRGRIIPLARAERNAPGFLLTEAGTIRPFDGTTLALIDTPDPRLLNYYLQQAGMTRQSLTAKTRAWLGGTVDGSEIEIPPDKGSVLVVVDRDHVAWLVKLAPGTASYTATTLRIGRLFPE